MENAVNSVKNLIEVNTEPSLVGNYLEGVTTRVEPKAKAMAIITHSIWSNSIEKRSAPDNKGDDIVWSAWKHVELGRNDLATFGAVYFNMTGTAIGNQLIKKICRFPVAIGKSVRANMVNIKALVNFGFSNTAKLTGIIVSLAGFRRLLSPVLPSVTLRVALMSPSIWVTFSGGSAPNHAFPRTVLAVCLSSLMGKGLTAVLAYLRNFSDITRIVCTRINLTAKLQKAFTAARSTSLRIGGEVLSANNAESGNDFGLTVTLLRTVSAILSREFYTTYRTSSHNYIVA